MKEEKKIHYPLALKRKIPLHIMSNFVKFHILMLSTLTDFMYLILKQLNIEYILYQILTKELLTSAVFFCCSKSAFEWLTNLPIKKA